MSSTRLTVEEVAALVRSIGRTALSTMHETIEIKRDGSFVTDRDVVIQKELEARLNERWPDIPLMGEEMPEDQRDQILRNCPEFWCADPLDGTTNFTSGLPFFGISLALIRHGETQIGVVYDPERDESFAAELGGGATLNGQALATTQEANSLHCIACVDFKRLARTLSEHLVAQPPYKSQRNLGACVLEWCWLAAGRFQLYLHGGQKLWDYAAGSLILNESGGRAVTLDGVDIPDPEHKQYLSRKISVVAASNPRLLEDWVSWIHDRAELYNLLISSGNATRN